MSGENLFVFALIGVTAALMASNKVRFDIVSLLVVLSLMLSGILSVGEALSGFGNPVVIMVAGLVLVAGMLPLAVEPGWYGFMDFVKVGVPLTLLTWIVTLLLAPLLFPFQVPL